MNETWNGAVLPSGLLDAHGVSEMAGFDKTYRNWGLRVGIITKMFAKNDDRNISKMFPEYEVLVFEQNEDKGATVITYRNCIASQGFGSKADFLEYNYRKMKNKTSKGTTPSMGGQNGAAVILQCLDGMSDKAIIMSGFQHPDRPTTLLDEEPHLEGEYNGINIKVQKDGSTTLTFKGATDNDGKVIDSSQGVTTLKIEKDGTFQADNENIMFRMDRTTKDATLTAKKDINLKAEGMINLTATADISAKCVNLKVEASGKADVKIGGEAKIDVGADCELKASGSVKVDASSIALNGKGGRVLTTLTDPLTDFITGSPSIGFAKVTAGP